MKGQPRSMRSHPTRINRFLAVTALVLSLPIAARATTITLDFSSLPTGTFTSALSVDGFTLTPRLSGSSTPTIVDVGGVYALESSANNYEQGADTFLTLAGGGTFTLDSIEVAALNGDTGHFTIGIGAAPSELGYVYGEGCSNEPQFVCGGPLSSTFTTENYAGVSGFENVTLIDLD